MPKPVELHSLKTIGFELKLSKLPHFVSHFQLFLEFEPDNFGLAEQAYQYYKHTIKGDNHKAPVTPAPTSNNQTSVTTPIAPVDDDPEVFKEPQSSEQK